MWSASVSGPVIQVIVPSVISPASSSILRPEGGDEDRARLAALDVDGRLGAHGLALEVDGPLVDERPQDREVLPHVADRLVERQAHDRLDHQLVREPDAEREPAVARARWR